jgi:phage-related protein
MCLTLTSLLVGTKSFVTHQVDMMISGIPEIETNVNEIVHIIFRFIRMLYD